MAQLKWTSRAGMYLAAGVRTDMTYRVMRSGSQWVLGRRAEEGPWASVDTFPSSTAAKRAAEELEV